MNESNDICGPSYYEKNQEVYFLHFQTAFQKFCEEIF